MPGMSREPKKEPSLTSNVFVMFIACHYSSIYALTLSRVGLFQHLHFQGGSIYALLYLKVLRTCIQNPEIWV